MRRTAGYVVLEQELPANFRGLVGIYPQALFRPEKVQTFDAPWLVLNVGGQHRRCDGSLYQIENGHTLSIGNFIAFDVINERDSVALLKLEISGATIDAEGMIGRGGKIGLVLAREPDPAPRAA